MKKLLLIAAISCSAVMVFAQGQVAMQNNSATRTVNPAGTASPAAGSTTVSVGLYWGTAGSAEASLVPLPNSSYDTATVWSPFAGIFNRGLATFPVAGGTQVSLQVRAWSSGYATYEAALASGIADGSVVAGKGIVQLITLGNAPGVPAPSPAASLITPSGAGDTPFQRFTIAPVPEPSSIALGLLGLGAVALFRRRK
jgi:hypothetical protein